MRVLHLGRLLQLGGHIHEQAGGIVDKAVRVQLRVKLLVAHNVRNGSHLPRRDSAVSFRQVVFRRCLLPCGGWARSFGPRFSTSARTAWLSVDGI